MTLEQVRDLVALITADKGIDVNLNGDDLADLLNLAQLKYYKLKIGLPEEYQPGMPLPRQAYEITDRMMEDLRVFKKVIGANTSTPITLDANGHYTLPSDYFIATSFTYAYVVSGAPYDREIKRLNDLQYNKAITKVASKPDEWYPVCNLQSTFIRFSPILTGNISMVYLRFPVKPVYAVKETDGYYEYDSVNSTELEWGDMQIIDIITILLGDLGLELKSADIINYSENLKAKGV